MSRYFRYISLVIFIAAVLLIVFLQFNSNRSINKLIEGNENLLSDLEIKTNLQRLQTDITALENKVRGAVISGSEIEAEHLQDEIAAVNTSLKRVDNLAVDSSIQPLLVELNRYVNSKMDFNTRVLDTFRLNGKRAAERIINIPYGKRIMDSIQSVSHQIDNLHQLTVTSLIKEADSNGNKAKTLEL